jgi:hypothetical protein
MNAWAAAGLIIVAMASGFYLGVLVMCVAAIAKESDARNGSD